MEYKHKIIGIKGNKNSGKNVVAKFIHDYLKNIDNTTNIKDFAFADLGKKLCSNIYGIDIKYFYSRKHKDELFYNIKNKSFYTEKEVIDNKYAILDISKLIIINTNNGSFYGFNFINNILNIGYVIKLRDLIYYTLDEVIRKHINYDIFTLNTIQEVINYNNDNLNNISIITDVRSKKEEQCIINNGGIIIEIERIYNNPNNYNMDNVSYNRNSPTYILNDSTFEILENKVLDLIDKFIIK